MIKKICLSVFFVLSMFSFAASSQQIGSWNMYQVFSGNKLQKLIDTDKEVYMLSDGWLYSYDKENDEIIYYNKMNKMSDTDISDIYYNYSQKYLFVAYSNSNIDLLYRNGKTKNIPDLKNVIMTSSKKINSVDFSGDYAYVATDFGYMVVNCGKGVIKESFNYGKSIYSIMATDKYIYANFDKKLYVSDIDAKHYEISSFKVTNFAQQSKLIKIDNDNFLLNPGWFYHAEIKDNPAQLVLKTLMQAQAQSVTKSGDGYIASYKDYYLKLDAKGNLAENGKVDFPEGIDGSFTSSLSGGGSLWNMDKEGLQEFKLDSGGGVTYLHESVRPNATSVTQPFYMVYDNHKLYEMSTAPNFLGAEDVDKYLFNLSVLEDGVWKNLSPENTTFINNNSKNTLTRPFGLNIDNDGFVWFGTWWEGVYCIKDNKQIRKFDNSNSPFYLNHLCCVPDLKIDGKGNLWAVFFNYKDISYPQLHMLPTSKKYRDDVQASDWLSWDFGSLEINYLSKIHINDDRYVLLADNTFKTKLCVLDNNGTPENVADDNKVMLSSFVDQDGKTFEIGYFNCFTEDADGKIWVGTEKGIGVINNMKSAFSNNFKINRIKVARNDGTNLADYLLDGMSVTSIAVDGANRKWVGTTTSGLYLVSADGSEILQHLTSENSILADDNITAVVCSTDNNKVYVGTKKGTFVYQSDAVRSEADYSNVYAYPNPVRSDYSGYITVTGLMENSLVKIADAKGNVICSGKSTGGMFVWDGCGSDGSKVNTGVYYVFASQTEKGSSNGCVTKILVVK